MPDGAAILCGSRQLLADHGIAIGGHHADPSWQGTTVYIALDGTLSGRFHLSDAVRTGAAAMVAELAGNGIETRLVSGDSPEAVSMVSAAIGISQADSCMTPDMKMQLVRDTRARGCSVLMAGDGVNDAPALAAADVSCSISGGSDIALENADIIITASDLSSLAHVHGLARTAMLIIRQNLVWAFAYNLVGIPLAMFGLLTPVYAAIAMTASSLMVSLNSLRLMRYRRHG